MVMNSDEMIGRLVADLGPVNPLLQRTGMTRILFAIAISVGLVIYGFGVRADITAGRPDPLFLTSAGLFLVLALASAWSAIDMARPAVGIRRDGWAWTVMMAAVLPITAMGLIAIDLFRGEPVYVDAGGIECLTSGCIAGALTLTALVLWLRKGAPSSPRLAATLIGVASGASGIFAVSLCCPENSLVHIGVWHGGTVVLMGIFGRLALPRFLAW